MSELSPQEIEQLILGYEDLEPVERAVADKYLDRHPSLAARLTWHQEKESRAMGELPVSDMLGQNETLDPALEKAQKASLHRILTELKLGGEAVASVTGPAPAQAVVKSRRWRQARWVLPLAAVLALVVLFPRGTVPTDLLHQLSIRQMDLMSDGSRGAGRTVPQDQVLHSGEAFALDFSLREDAFVVVYHVDPAGQITRVFPESLSAGLAPHRGGRGHQIPGPDSGETWILGSETGTESFLVAACPQSPAELGIPELETTGLDRVGLLSDLKSRLERLGYEVDLYEFDHVD